MSQLALFGATTPSTETDDTCPELAFLDPERPVVWTEEDSIKVHIAMLREVACLANPRATLASKLEILRWVFTEPELDDAPFSFATCVACAALSELSPHPYMGRVDIESARDLIRQQCKKWLRHGYENYPLWVQEEISKNPDWVCRNASKNATWLNKQIKKVADTGDLFV